jgi:hypothetical protein
VEAVPQGWFSRRAVPLHLTLLVLLPAFGAACWWQVDRALSGNGLSWAYVFEWPFFAGYAVFVWWKLVHDTFEQPAPAGDQRGSSGPGVEPSVEDDELAAYNRYLSELEVRGRPKRW